MKRIELALALLLLLAGTGNAATVSRTSKAEIQWVKIPGGSFTMGSADTDLVKSRPTHQVTVKSFQMAKTLVTNKQYKACVAAGACAAAHISDGACSVNNGTSWSQGSLPASFQGDDQPAVCVDWEQARTFSKWAGGRLPTEAEWEYAARSAGQDQQYPWGKERATCAHAVALGCGSLTTAPVCSKPLGNTRQGLCDMAGNAWEWVEDGYHESYEGAPTDGSAWKNGGSFRVFRGGSWNYDSGNARSAIRYYYGSDRRGNDLGFRLAR